MTTINFYLFPCNSEKNTIYCNMVIKRAGLKVVNDVLFLSKITFECSPKTLFSPSHWRALVGVLQKLLC